MKYFWLLFVLVIHTQTAFGQQPGIAQFAVWKVREGQLQNFENGYKKHLMWHKKNGDNSGWWGWFFVSGPRYGQFIDATFNHAWSDFDNAVNPAEDMADNKLHVFPFAELQSTFKVKHYALLSTVDTFNNKLKIARMLTITFGNPRDGLQIIDRMKAHYTSRQIKSFQVYAVIDGGALNEFIILMGFDNWAEFGISEDATDKLFDFANGGSRATVTSVRSETIAYRPDLSWFP